jgi:predicted XRE-type DNA-binding protein
MSFMAKYTAAIFQATGIPQGNISRIERGKIQDIHLSRFVVLMRTLGVSADYLLGLELGGKQEAE